MLATVAALPAAFTGYMLGYHSALPAFGGGPISVIIPTCAVWGSVFATGALRAWLLSLWQLDEERDATERNRANKTPLPTPVERPPSNHGPVPGAADL